MRWVTFGGTARCPQRAAGWNESNRIHECGAQGLMRPISVSPDLNHTYSI